MEKALETEQDILDRIATIKKYAERRDHEAAHDAEDDLREQVLEAIANGTCPDPKRWAQLALSTNEIDMNRWCA